MPIHILNSKHGVPARDLIIQAASGFQRRRQHRHELWILTCYVELSLIEEIVREFHETVRITDVYLAFNFSEIYKLGPIETQRKLKIIKAHFLDMGITFEWSALQSSRLVHGKGYAVIQRFSGNLSDGVVLTTSANFTRAGFTGSNVELGYFSTAKRDLQRFEEAYNYLWSELGQGIDSAVFEQGSYLLKFAILSSGVFLHKWSGSLSQQIGIKYTLTSLAKEKGSIAPELAAVGFEAGNTFSRQVLNLVNLPQKEVPRSFMSRFTIETYWGRWCPSEAWQSLSNTFSGSEQFIEEFLAATDEDKLLEIKKEALEVQEQLIAQGLIKPVGNDHLDRWVEKMLDLRLNKGRLDRFFTGYEAHRLPYTIDQDDEVVKLFESLEEAIELSKATNIAKQKVSDAIVNSDPDLIKINIEETEIIQTMQYDF